MRLPEERLDAFEAESDDLADIGGRDPARWRGPWFRCGCRERSHCTSFKSDVDAPARSALSIAPSTMARLWMLSSPTVSGSLAGPDRRDEIRRYAEMPVDPVVGASGGGLDRRRADRTDPRALPDATTSIRISIAPSQVSVPLAPTMRHAHSHDVRKPSAHQRAAIGEDGAVLQFENRRPPRSRADTRNSSDSTRGNRRPSRRARSCSATRRRRGSPCRAAAHGPSPRESRRNAAQGRNRRARW